VKNNSHVSYFVVILFWNLFVLVSQVNVTQLADVRATVRASESKINIRTEIDINILSYVE
jgi:hypothetical protein